MDSFEMNKILGAILGTALVVVALNIASGAIFAPEMPAKPGYNIVVPKAATGTQAPAQKEPPVAQLLATATPSRRAAPPRSGPISGASSAVRAPPWRASIIRAA